MTAMLLGPDEEKLIAALIVKASGEVMPFTIVQKIAGQTRTPELAKMNNDKTIAMPVGFRVTYTHEEQRPGLACRHLSVSNERGVPPPAIMLLMERFGFKNTLADCGTYIERIGAGEFEYAINVIEPLDGDMTPLKRRLQ